jgi:UDP-N-acetyl-D-glucosamine dehydrogenase
MDKIIGVVGLGYVGLPLALTAVESGWNVIGFDKNSNLVRNLTSGESHIDDVSNERLLVGLSGGKFLASDDPAALSNVDICIICVPTPITSQHEPDLTYVKSAVSMISKVLKSSSVLVNESTSYPGTLRNVIQRELALNRGELGDIGGYVAAPERVDPKNIKFNHSNTPRVLGGDNPLQVQRVSDFYSSLGPEVTIVSSPEAAELSKLIENAFRLVNISFVNELTPYASAIGVDLIEVLNAAATKPFGFMKFTPGPGVGGHCIPVDPHYLLDSAKGFNVELPVLNSAIEVNLQVPQKVIERVRDLLGANTHTTVLLVGIAYKDGISDTRETPALPIAKGLLDEGYKVFWTDDAVSKWETAQEYSGQKIDLAIALSSSTLHQLQQIPSDVKILDCTGKHTHLSNVISYFNS